MNIPKPSHIGMAPDCAREHIGRLVECGASLSGTPASAAGMVRIQKKKLSPEHTSVVVPSLSVVVVVVPELGLLFCWFFLVVLVVFGTSGDFDLPVTTEAFDIMYFFSADFSGCLIDMSSQYG